MNSLMSSCSERVLAAEHELGQGLGQLRLADARGAQEDVDTDRPSRVLQPGAGAAHRLGDGLDGLVLAHDALVQRALPSAAAARSPRRRCAPRARRSTWPRPRRCLRPSPPGPRPPARSGSTWSHSSRSRFRNAHGFLVVLAREGLVLLLLHLSQLGERLLEARRVRDLVHPHAAGGLVDQVDGLVGQEAIGDVARRPGGPPRRAPRR